MDSEGTCVFLSTFRAVKWCTHQRAKSLVAKFKHAGGTSYIEEAIDLHREALQLCPPSHPRSVPLTRLANDISDHCNQLGAMQDLDEAIVIV